MRIKKSEDKPEREEEGLSRREDWPWTMDSFRDFERYFDPLFRDVWRTFPGPIGRRWGPSWLGRSGPMALAAPATDLRDTGRQFILRAEMPGVSKDDIDITVHDDYVEIKAERESGKEEEHEGYYYREIGKSSYYRRIPLPEEVEVEKTDGKLENGVLELTLPKLNPTESKSHKVKLH